MSPERPPNPFAFCRDEPEAPPNPFALSSDGTEGFVDDFVVRPPKNVSVHALATSRDEAGTPPDPFEGLTNPLEARRLAQEAAQQASNVLEQLRTSSGTTTDTSHESQRLESIATVIQKVSDGSMSEAFAEKVLDSLKPADGKPSLRHSDYALEQFDDESEREETSRRVERPPPIPMVVARGKPNPTNVPRYSEYTNVAGFMPSTWNLGQLPSQKGKKKEVSECLNGEPSVTARGASHKYHKIYYCSTKGCMARIKLSHPRVPDGYLYFCCLRNQVPHSAHCPYNGFLEPAHRFPAENQAAIDDQVENLSTLTESIVL